MGVVEILFLLYTTFSNIHASNDNLCPGSNCGNLYINYPFKDQSTQTQDSCTYIDLKCEASLFNGEGAAILSLPHAGEFYISDIFYDIGWYIKLADPGSCLMKRLMNNLNLSSSPFKAITYENYTFYTCPTAAIDLYFWPIDCLSNATNSTVATSTATPADMLPYGCQLIGSWLLPVLDKGQLEWSSDDLYLTWDSTSCIGCEDQKGDKGESKGLAWAKIVSSPFFLPSFVTAVMLTIVCVSRIIKYIFWRNESNSDDGLQAPSPPQSFEPSGRGLDESKISSCTELVILGESIITAASHTCSICLESYRPQQLVRSIAKCGHSFHAHCIQQWLIKSTTCPVCRTLLCENGL
ncbi:hypothetical protein ACS0TY_002361 [Phlomoides rotata]